MDMHTLYVSQSGTPRSRLVSLINLFGDVVPIEDGDLEILGSTDRELHLLYLALSYWRNCGSGGRRQG